MTWDFDADKKSVVSGLKEELDSWRKYADALRQEDREVFREMTNEVIASYSEAIERAERGYDTEALLISILLAQQKMLNWAIHQIKQLKEPS